MQNPFPLWLPADTIAPIHCGQKSCLLRRDGFVCKTVPRFSDERLGRALVESAGLLVVPLLDAVDLPDEDWICQLMPDLEAKGFRTLEALLTDPEVTVEIKKLALHEVTKQLRQLHDNTTVTIASPTVSPVAGRRRVSFGSGAGSSTFVSHRAQPPAPSVSASLRRTCSASISSPIISHQVFPDETSFVDLVGAAGAESPKTDPGCFDTAKRVFRSQSTLGVREQFLRLGGFGGSIGISGGMATGGRSVCVIHGNVSTRNILVKVDEAPTQVTVAWIDFCKTKRNEQAARDFYQFLGALHRECPRESERWVQEVTSVYRPNFLPHIVAKWRSHYLFTEGSALDSVRFPVLSSTPSIKETAAAAGSPTYKPSSPPSHAARLLRPKALKAMGRSSLKDEPSTWFCRLFIGFSAIILVNAAFIASSPIGAAVIGLVATLSAAFGAYFLGEGLAAVGIVAYCLHILINVPRQWIANGYAQS